MTKRFILLPLGLAASLPALACTTCDDKAASPAAPTTVAASAAADALTVVRDAESGQLRAPTAAELAAMARRQADMARSGRQIALPTAPMIRRAASGAVNVRLTPEFTSHAVMVRLPDGTLAERCVQAADATGALAQARASLAPATPTAELK
jgi:hypothetical protein